MKKYQEQMEIPEDSSGQRIVFSDTLFRAHGSALHYKSMYILNNNCFVEESGSFRDINSVAESAVVVINKIEVVSLAQIESQAEIRYKVILSIDVLKKH